MSRLAWLGCDDLRTMCPSQLKLASRVVMQFTVHGPDTQPSTRPGRCKTVSWWSRTRWRLIVSRQCYRLYAQHGTDHPVYTDDPCRMVSKPRKRCHVMQCWRWSNPRHQDLDDGAIQDTKILTTVGIIDNNDGIERRIDGVKVKWWLVKDIPQQKRFSNKK